MATLVYSRRASQAATEARNTALSRTLAEDINHASRAASEVGIHVSGGHYQAAAFRVSGLQEHTSYLVTRWSDFLGEPSRGNLLVARSQLREIMVVLLSTSGGELSSKARKDLARACDEVSAIFHEEYGAALNAIDSEVTRR